MPRSRVVRRVALVGCPVALVAVSLAGCYPSDPPNSTLGQGQQTVPAVPGDPQAEAPLGGGTHGPLARVAPTVSLPWRESTAEEERAVGEVLSRYVSRYIRADVRACNDVFGEPPVESTVPVTPTAATTKNPRSCPELVSMVPTFMSERIKQSYRTSRLVSVYVAGDVASARTESIGTSADGKVRVRMFRLVRDSGAWKVLLGGQQ